MKKILSTEINLSFLQTVSFQDKLFFTKHLATMLQAGIPLSEALETLHEQAQSAGMQKVLLHAIEEVKNGKSLEESLSQYPKTFDKFYTSLIEVGEQSGTLEKSLSFLAKQLTKDYNLRKKIQGALLYPALIFFSTIVMGSFITIFVLPKLVDFFEAFDFPLPITTKILLWFAVIAKNHGIVLVSCMILSVILFFFLIRIKSVKKIWHKYILHFPIFGKFLMYAQLARFSRNFGVLLESGLPVNRSLHVTAHTLSNLIYQKSVYQLSNQLEKGESLHDALMEKNFSHFPPIVRKMIGVGEKTGNLDNTLLYLSDFYEEEIDNMSKNLSTILEPLLLLVIGIMVGFVAIAIISPIYELTGSIRTGSQQ